MPSTSRRSWKHLPSGLTRKASFLGAAALAACDHNYQHLPPGCLLCQMGRRHSSDHPDTWSAYLQIQYCQDVSETRSYGTEDITLRLSHWKSEAYVNNKYQSQETVTYFQNLLPKSR